MTEWWAVLVPLLSATLGAAVGGLLVHRLTLIRDVRGTRRSQRVDYLISAYRRLIDAANRPGGLTPDQVVGLESALSDVVLLGEPGEVEEARVFMLAMADGEGAELDPLIRSLRGSLRRELLLTNTNLPHPYNLRMDGGEA